MTKTADKFWNRPLTFSYGWRDTIKIALISAFLVSAIMVFLQPFDTFSSSFRLKSVKLAIQAVALAELDGLNRPFRFRSLTTIRSGSAFSAGKVKKGVQVEITAPSQGKGNDWVLVRGSRLISAATNHYGNGH